MGGQDRASDLGPCGGRARLSEDGAELFEHELGREVVALDVHAPQDLRERRRPARGQRPAAGVGALRRPVHANACPRERLTEERRGSESAVHSRDRERGQCLRLAGDVSGLPARAAPAPVEPRLVGDEASGHVADPGVADALGEPGKPGPVERRVTAAPQDKAARPDAARPEPALPQRRGLHPERRAEPLQSRVRDDQLLVRGGEQGVARAVRVDDPAGRQIDRERGRPRPGEAGQRCLETRTERRRGGRLRHNRRDERRRHRDTNREHGPHSRKR